MPTVSVIIPTYNRAHLIGRAIQSVLDQTYQDFEIKVVDDSSADETEEIVRKFKDKRIQYIRHTQNKGGPAARNVGIKMASGEFIGFLDDDDEWLPKKLEKQMRIFHGASPRIGVVYTGFWRIQDNKKTYMPVAIPRKNAGVMHENLLKQNFVDTSTAIVRRKCFNKAGMFDETLPAYQDWEMWIRISRSYDFFSLREALVNSYVTQRSISSNYEAGLIAMEIILEKHLDEFSKDRTILAQILYAMGSDWCKHGKLALGRRYILRAIKVYPLKIKFFIAFFLSLFTKKIYERGLRLRLRGWINCTLSKFI